MHFLLNLDNYPKKNNTTQNSHLKEKVWPSSKLVKSIQIFIFNLKVDILPKKKNTYAT